MKRPSRPAEDEGSYLASVSDLMSGLIFIFIIALVTFALGLREQEERLSGATNERQRLLNAVQKALEREGIAVTVAPEQGVVRLGESLLFPLGKADLEPNGKTTVGRLAVVLGRVLPCYTNAPQDLHRPDCGALGKAGQVDALFIEGHTDDLQMAGYGVYKDNWDLSMARAKTIFRSLTEGSPEARLDDLRNQDGQRVLGLSGYADRRGIVDNLTDANRGRNRRIDLRFVMVPPKDALPAPAAETKREMQR